MKYTSLPKQCSKIQQEIYPIANHHLEKHMQETPVQYIMWRFAGNDDKESLEFQTQELSDDEEQARAQKWCIDAVTGGVRLCTNPKEDPKKAKQDEGNAVIPDAVLNRRQKSGVGT